MTASRHNFRDLPRSSSRSRWVIWVKLALTAAILAFLVSQVDAPRFWKILRDAAPTWLLAACGWQSLSLVTSTLKWDGLLRDLRIFSPRWDLLRLYTIGFFASAFLPGLVGGDVIRWYLTGRREGERVRIAATILAERVTGAVALAVLSVAAISGDPGRLATLPILLVLIGFAGLLTLSLAVALNRRLAISLRQASRGWRIAKLVRRLYELHKTIRAFTPRALAAALGWSFLFNLAGAITLFFLCIGFGLDLTFVEAFAVRVIVNLFTLIPLSIGGLGINQAGDVFLLGIMGVDPSQAFAIAIARQLIALVYQLIGGLFFLQWRVASPRPARDSDAAPLG